MTNPPTIHLTIPGNVPPCGPDERHRPWPMSPDHHDVTCLACLAWRERTLRANPRDPMDPKRYEYLLAQTPAHVVDQWGFNHRQTFGQPLPVPHALYDFYRDQHGPDAVRNLTPVQRTLF